MEGETTSGEQRPEHPYSEMAIAFTETARTLFSDTAVGGTLQRIVDFAVVTVEGCDAAGIFLLTQTEVTTPVYSDPVVLEIDSVQYEAGEGPWDDRIVIVARYNLYGSRTED
jgi:hypothetical protein